MEKTEFDVNVWRGWYNQVHILGEHLKDTFPDQYGNPPKVKISDEERIQLEKDIDHLLKMSDRYLDKCRLIPHPPKWNFDRNNETTWASSEKFLFHDVLIKHKKKYLSIPY